MNQNQPGRCLNGALLESAVEIRNQHVIFGRAEYVAKDELFLNRKVYNVGKVDLGYMYEFPLIPYTLWGLGVVGSASFVPHGTPLSYMAFLRIELME
jgi:hypothetical protein